MILAFFKVVASKTNLSTFPINGTAKVHNLSDKTIFTRFFSNFAPDDEGERDIHGNKGRESP